MPTIRADAASRSPPAAAGSALPLVLEGGDGRLHVGEEAAAYLASLRGPVALICSAGTPHSGKSFLANRLLGNMDGFRVRGGSRRSDRTRCVWLWPSAQHVLASEPGGGTQRVALVVLDCQGLDAEEDDELRADPLRSQRLEIWWPRPNPNPNRDPNPNP